MKVDTLSSVMGLFFAAARGAAPAGLESVWTDRSHAEPRLNISPPF